MAGFINRRMVVIFTLLLGIVLSLVWLVGDRDPPPTQGSAVAQEKRALRLEVPQKAWVQIFFREIDERTKGANLTNLRATLLADDAIEVRLWEIAGYHGLDGIVLRRSAGKWSATYLHGISTDPNDKRTYQGVS